MSIPIESFDRKTRFRHPAYRSPAVRGTSRWYEPYGVRTAPDPYEGTHDPEPEDLREAADEFVEEWETRTGTHDRGTRPNAKEAAAKRTRRKNGYRRTREQNGRKASEKPENDFPEIVEGTELVNKDDETYATGSDNALTDDWKNRYQRLLADFENHKRHAEAERTRLAGVGKETVLDDIFPIIDHLQRAIQATRDAGGENGILEGIEMVYNEFIKALEKHGVNRIKTVGEPFNPTVHEAVAVTEHPAYPEDTVVEEVRNGFTRGDKLLRPAHVVVGR